ncbi:MAG: efflux RND transporter permease subunit [Pseudomonadota bacterium]
MTEPREPSTFNLSLWALRKQPLVLFFSLAILLMGSFAYFKLGQSEDPPFTFKVMIIRSYLSGASAHDVEVQLTDRLEKKLQDVAYLDWIRSYSKPGESLIFLAIKDSAPPEKVSETWYQVRKKLGDIHDTLPQGTQGPFFNDEFGDTYVHIFALSGKGVDMATLKDYAERVKGDLLRLPGIAKIDMLGEQDEKVYIELSNTRLATLGLTVEQLLGGIQKHLALPAHTMIQNGSERVVVRLQGVNTWENIGDLVFYGTDHQRMLKLKDIATIKRGYSDPPNWTMHFQGEPVIGLGVVMLPGYNVMTLGKHLDERHASLKKQLPVGFSLEIVTSMSNAVGRSITEFLHSLIEAIAIVLAVSLLSLGLRTGTIVMMSIPIVLAGSFALMDVFDIGLHKISLGALILSLGLLVDDAIIAVESMLVKIEEGWDRVAAAGYAYTNTAFPMLIGTLVTVVGFLPIAMAKSATGEYTRSIFQVTAIALLLSWLVAVIVIPYLGYYLIPKPKPQPKNPHQKTFTQRFKHFLMWLFGIERSKEEVSLKKDATQDRSSSQENGAESSPDEENRTDNSATKTVHQHVLYQSAFYVGLRHKVTQCVTYRKTTLLVTLIVFLGSIVLFKLVPQQFFPDSSRPELLVDLKLSDGSSYAATRLVVERFEGWLKNQTGLENRTCYVGNGSPRFYLPLDQQMPSPNFAQCVLLTTNKEERERLRLAITQELTTHFQELRGRVSRLENGPPVGFPVQFRVSGRDALQTRALANQVADTVRHSPLARNVQLDWDEPMKALHIRLDHVALQRLGLTPEYLGDFIQGAFQGLRVTTLREGIESPEVLIRAYEHERVHIEKLPYLMIPTPTGQRVALKSLAQIEAVLEEAVIWRRDRLPTFTVRADVVDGVQGADAAKEIDQSVQAFRKDLPLGYRIDIGGVIEDSSKGQDSIAAGFPLMLALVVALLMFQLNRFSRVFMVLVTAPLGLVGVSLALLLFGKPFGFVAMLGTIALSGIIMRNTLILVDQIDNDIMGGASTFDAIIEATIRRFRPICLTALAAVLGLIPLSRSDFFGPMAVAMMGGITIATLLTIVVVPSLYAVIVGAKVNKAG